jgi:exopolyphosphatase/guanosine-5'-triphosphate,3'-diphosphate pyrophosphatase
MAALLRVAIGLDRNHDGAVADIAVEQSDGSVTLRLNADDPTSDLTLEQYSADHRSSLLATQLGCPVVVEAGSSTR